MIRKLRAENAVQPKRKLVRHPAVPQQIKKPSRKRKLGGSLLKRQRKLRPCNLGMHRALQPQPPGTIFFALLMCGGHRLWISRGDRVLECVRVFVCGGVCVCVCVCVCSCLCLCFVLGDAKYVF